MSESLSSAESGLLALQPAKLIQPYQPSFQIRRPQLSNALCADNAPRVSLIRAPAGFGKSTLMQQAYAQLQRDRVSSVWLSFDAADNDVPRLLHFLGKVMEQLDPCDQGIKMGLSAGPLALELLDRITLLPTPFVLFLDDLETLQNPVALAFIRQLIEQMPAGGRIILGSRSIPDIGLTKLRTSGQLQEMDSSKLRFTQAESAQLLREKSGLELSDAAMTSLQKTTEGWPAALWLASLLLEASASPESVVEDFSGSSALVADYLGEEVLAQQPDELCQFMLRTSLLPQMNAALCDAVLGISHSRTLLTQLEQSNLFLVPLDLERKWFRYHSLFAVFLREQLEQRHPEQLPALHRAAAEWYLQQQRPVPAIEQALLSGDMAFALPLFARHGQRLLGEGRALLLTRLLQGVNPDSLRAWPDLQVVHVWAIAFTRGSSEAMTLLSEYETTGEPDQLLHFNAMALKPMLLSMLDRHDESYLMAEQDMDRLSSQYAFPHAILRTSLSYVALVMGKYQQAQALLDEGRRLNVIDVSPFTHIYAQSVEGVIELLQGRLRQATSRFRLATGEKQGSGRFATNGNAMAAILLAETFYEAGDLVTCERLLQVYVPLMQQQGVPDHLICGLRNLARIYFERGDVDAALQAINEMEYYGQRNGLPRLVACAHLERARLCVLAGDAAASREELDRAAALADWEKLSEWFLFGTDVEYLALAELRWQIHFGHPTETIEPLAKMIERADKQRRGRRALKLKVLQALAYSKSGQDKLAFTLLRDILQLASVEHSMRLILDEGESMIELLQKMAGAQKWVLNDGLLSNPLQLFQRLLVPVECATQSAGVPLVPGEAPELVEKLTKKEFKALQLLAEGLSNAEIGSRLFVSESTVRTHLRNVNAKLHSKSRTEAVAIARRLGILD